MDARRLRWLAKWSRGGEGRGSVRSPGALGALGALLWRASSTSPPVGNAGSIASTAKLWWLEPSEDPSQAICTLSTSTSSIRLDRTRTRFPFRPALASPPAWLGAMAAHTANKSRRAAPSPLPMPARRWPAPCLGQSSCPRRYATLLLDIFGCSCRARRALLPNLGGCYVAIRKSVCTMLCMLDPAPQCWRQVPGI